MRSLSNLLKKAARNWTLYFLMGKLYLLAPKATQILPYIKTLIDVIGISLDIAKILGPYGLLAVSLGIYFGPSLVFKRLFGTQKKNMELESNFSVDTIEDDVS